jgi:hypothetical protein
MTGLKVTRIKKLQERSKFENKRLEESREAFMKIVMTVNMLNYWHASSRKLLTLIADEKPQKYMKIY